MTDKPTITQADRDAVDAVRKLIIKQGMDKNPTETQRRIHASAFAKHREAAVIELKAEAEQLRKALRMAANQFRYYEENHQLKGTSDGVAKAETNRRCAEQCEAALAQKEPVE